MVGCTRIRSPHPRGGAVVADGRHPAMVCPRRRRPGKIAALLDAAQHWALRLETCQEARCDASREISDAVDWSAVAREVKQLADFYAAKPWLKRVVAS